MKLIRMALAAAAAIGTVASAFADGLALIRNDAAGIYNVLNISGSRATAVPVHQPLSSSDSTIIGHLFSKGTDFEIAQTEIYFDLDWDFGIQIITYATIAKYDGETGRRISSKTYGYRGLQKLIAFCDLDGDGNREILMQDNQTRTLVAYEYEAKFSYSLNEIRFKDSEQTLDYNLRCIGVGLVNDGANEDLIFENTSTHEIHVAQMNKFVMKRMLGKTMNPADIQSGGFNGRLVGVADFNNDGAWDLYSESSSRPQMKHIWFMNTFFGSYNRNGGEATVSTESNNTYSRGWTTIAVGNS